MKKLAAAVARVARAVVAYLDFEARDLTLFVGVALLGYGAAQIFVPAGFILSGAVLAAVAVFGVRGQAQPPEAD